MNKTLYLVVFALAMATAVAVAQTSAGGASTQAQPASPAWGPPSQTTPASQDTDKHEKSKNNDKSPVDDATLTTQVQEQLAGDPALKNVQATVNNGVVNLDGTVASKADKKRAKQVVAAIPGVRKVHDRLTVNANATVTPGSNEPATAKAGAGSSATASGNTAGSIAGNAGASSTTPQAPAATASNPASRESGASANGMPQSDVSAGANAGIGTGAQAGAGVSGTSSGTASSTIPQSSTAGTAGATATGAGDSSTDLQKQVQTALKHEPTLANDNLNAVVTGDTIDLSGTVATGKERQTALRIAQSFAGNRRVVDRMTVAGQGAGANTGEPQRDVGPGASNPSSLPSSPNPSPESTPNPR